MDKQLAFQFRLQNGECGAKSGRSAHGWRLVRPVWVDGMRGAGSIVGHACAKTTHPAGRNGAYLVHYDFLHLKRAVRTKGRLIETASEIARISGESATFCRFHKVRRPIRPVPEK